MKDPLEDVQLSETRQGNFVVLAIILGALVVLFVASPWVAALIIGLVVMIMLHEAGHFLAARKTGMKATEYFVGFGPRLWSFKRGETEYGVKAIPAGGYVRIIGMSNLEEVPPEDEPRTFRRGTTKHRLIVILAGVTVNALLAWLLFTIALAGRGEIVEGPSTTVRQVVAESAAADAGLRAGDEFVAVDGASVGTWDELKRAIETRGGEETTFTVVRGERTVQLVAVPDERDGQGFLGVSPGSVVRDVSLLAAIPEGLRAMGDVTVGTAEGIGRIFTPSGVQQYSRNFTDDAPEQGSRADQERPRSLIGIVDEGSTIVEGNIWALFWLLGAISLVLALFNLLPLLPFDGGHAVVVIYEAVASRMRGHTVRVDFRKLMPVTAVVLAIFLTLGVSAMVLDIRDLAR